MNNSNDNKLIPASTVLIIRNCSSGIEVFMVVRHHQIDFASGALVFPGGKVDKNDYDENLVNYISKTDDNLPPYSAGIPPFIILISLIASALNTEKNPNK